MLHEENKVQDFASQPNEEQSVAEAEPKKEDTKPAPCTCRFKELDLPTHGKYPCQHVRYF